MEASHGHLKTGLEEALELCGSRAFTDLAADQAFLEELLRVRTRASTPRSGPN